MSPGILEHLLTSISVSRARAKYRDRKGVGSESHLQGVPLDLAAGKGLDAQLGLVLLEGGGTVDGQAADSAKILDRRQGSHQI